MKTLAEQLAFDGPGRVIAPAAVMTAHHGRNDAMIASVARLYIPDGATVIDATWGKGNFWTRTDTSRFRLIGTDLTSPSAAILADFRALPFARASLQRWSHITVHAAAKDLGLDAQDLFVLTTDTPPGGARAEQHHARRNHSYLWIFRKAAR